MQQRIMAMSRRALAGMLSAPTSPRDRDEKLNAKSDCGASTQNSKKQRPRRQSLAEWGSKTNILNSDINIVQERLQSLQEYVRKKEKRPHFSQIHCGKIEVLTADDDPVNQVMSLTLMSIHSPNCEYCSCSSFARGSWCSKGYSAH